ncbi:MAG: ABC transporter substrate-binding protein [Pseudomonadota bacterium]
MNILHALAIAAVTSIAIPTVATALDCPAGQRAFTHGGGESCIPEAPQRIVATRGDSLVTPLLDIGAPVIGAGFRETDGTLWIRGATDIFGSDFVDGLGMASVGNPNNVDIESVATLAPDLILVRQRELDRYDQFVEIAPTVVVPENLIYLEHMRFIADAAGLADTFQTRIDAYQAAVDKAVAMVGDPASITVSRMDVEPGGLWYYPNWGAIDQVITDMGFARPAIQADAPDGGYNGLSPERIMEFDGDVIITSAAPRFGQTIDMKMDEYASEAPVWTNLSAVQSGDLFWYERDILVGYTFESLHRSIEFLTAITAGRDFD